MEDENHYMTVVLREFSTAFPDIFFKGSSSLIMAHGIDIGRKPRDIDLCLHCEYDNPKILDEIRVKIKNIITKITATTNMSVSPIIKDKIRVGYALDKMKFTYGDNKSFDADVSYNNDKYVSFDICQIQNDGQPFLIKAYSVEYSFVHKLMSCYRHKDTGILKYKPRELFDMAILSSHIDRERLYHVFEKNITENKPFRRDMENVLGNFHAFLAQTDEYTEIYNDNPDINSEMLSRMSYTDAVGAFINIVADLDIHFGGNKNSETESAPERSDGAARRSKFETTHKTNTGLQTDERSVGAVGGI